MSTSLYAELCPICKQQLPENPSTYLRRLIQIAEWYNNGQAPSKARALEHRTLTCHIHRYESSAIDTLALENKWPRTLDPEWIQQEVHAMHDRLAKFITMAPASDQFQNVVELVQRKILDQRGRVVGRHVYEDAEGGSPRIWLRSAG